jgi:hypothetical protein
MLENYKIRVFESLRGEGKDFSKTCERAHKLPSLLASMHPGLQAYSL